MDGNEQLRYIDGDVMRSCRWNYLSFGGGAKVISQDRRALPITKAMTVTGATN